MNTGKNPKIQTVASFVLPTSTEGDSAVGVLSTQPVQPQAPAASQSRKWFVAVVKNNTEQKLQQFLESRGVESFAAVQLVPVRGKDGRNRPRPRIIIPARLMLHVTETERKDLVRLPSILRFLTDMAHRPDKFGHHPLAVIPDEQMARLRLVLAQASAEVEIALTPPAVGDRVVVTSGPLTGCEGIAVGDTYNGTILYVDFGILGCAKIRIEQAILEKKI